MGFLMLKEMELQCNSLWLVRARANQEQTDGELAENAGRLAPVSHKEQNTFLVSQNPWKGFVSHPKFNKHAQMFGAGLSVALHFMLSLTLVQKEQRPLHWHGQEHKSVLPSPTTVHSLSWAGAPAQLPCFDCCPCLTASLMCSWVDSKPQLPSSLFPTLPCLFLLVLVTGPPLL